MVSWEVFGFKSLDFYFVFLVQEIDVIIKLVVASVMLVVIGNHGDCMLIPMCLLENAAMM